MDLKPHEGIQKKKEKEEEIDRKERKYPPNSRMKVNSLKTIASDNRNIPKVSSECISQGSLESKIYGMSLYIKRN